MNSNISLELGFLDLNDKNTVSDSSNLLIKILVEKSTNQSASNFNDQSTLARANCLRTDLTITRTIPFNSETSMRVRSQKIHQNKF